MMLHSGKRFWTFRMFQGWEIVIFVIAFAAGLQAVDELGLWTGPDLPVSAQFAIIVMMCLLWGALVHKAGLYDSRRIVTRSNELCLVLATVVIAGGTLAVVGALFELPTNHGAFQTWFLGLALVLMGGSRMLTRAFLFAVRSHGRNLRFVAIVGAGDEGQKLAQTIIDKPSSGFELIGIFDNQPDLDALPASLPKSGSLEDLKSRLTKSPVDEVLIALPMVSHCDVILDMMAYCKKVGVSVRVVNEFVNHDSHNVSLDFIEDAATLHFSSESNWGWQGQAKLMLDWVLAAGALAVLAVPMLVVAILIKLDSPGPVFFIQTRVGKNRRFFKFYKFRTMVQNAEALQAQLEAQNEAEGPVFKIRRDPRVTRLGQFLRRYSIDELPQLINVVLGDMSLVGPRPLPVRDVQLFEKDWYNRRFSVRPGLTCSWVMAGRSELKFREWVQLDLDYIDNWSLGKDLNICLNTIPRVLRGSGAF